MSIMLRVAIMLSGVALILMARRASISRKMTERQSLFWIAGGCIIILFGLIPQIVYFISNTFSVEYPPSIIFTIAIVLATYGIFSCYRTNAELHAKVQELAMQISLLNEESAQIRKDLKEDMIISIEEVRQEIASTVERI